MKVGLQAVLSDAHLDANQPSSQRQLSLSLTAIDEQNQENLPLNLCLVLDHSGSMEGKPLETVKQAAINLVKKLSSRDSLSIIAFDHRAKVLIPHQTVKNVEEITEKIQLLTAAGGTAIDRGIKLGIQELAKKNYDGVDQIFLLTDGENEHGDNERCLKLAKLASEYKITINSLGFGNHWNQDVLEKIADLGNGSLSYIEKPEEATAKFATLFSRLQSVGLTNAYLLLDLMPDVRLAELKPIAQVAPDTIELPVQREGSFYCVRLGDLMKDSDRVILINLYLGKFPPGNQTLASVQVRYDSPGINQERLLSETIPVTIEVQQVYQPQPHEQVHRSILALAKYRQTQIAEAKLEHGDLAGAATMLQTAAKTALQLGDKSAATVLQTSATRLQSGEELSESEKKKTRIVSKTILQ